MASRSKGTEKIRLEEVRVRSLTAPPAEVPPNLEASVARVGVLRPVVVVELGKRRVVIEGRKRFYAACKVGLRSVPAVCLSVGGQALTELAKWHTAIEPEEQRKEDWNAALLAEAARRGLIRPEDAAELRGLSGRDLVQALRDIWEKKCKEEEQKRLEAQTEIQPPSDLSDSPPAQGGADAGDHHALAQDMALEYLAVDRFTSPQKERGPARGPAKRTAGGGQAAIPDRAVAVGPAVDLPPPPPDLKSRQEAAEAPAGSADKGSSPAGDGGDREGPEKPQEPEAKPRQGDQQSGSRTSLCPLVSGLFSDVAGKQRIPVEDVESLIRELLRRYKESPCEFLAWRELSEEDAFAAHSLLVAKLAVHLASSLKWTGSQVERFAAAALLHDVGLVISNWDPGRAEGAGPLWGETEDHGELGRRLVEQAGRWGAQVQSVCRDHHERWNGSGVPRGAKGEEVDLPARLIAIVDHFTLLMRPWSGPKLSPSKAIAALTEEVRSGAFDPATLRALVAHLSWYPLGSIFRLESGQIVRVVKADPRWPNNPQLQVIRGENEGKGLILQSPESIAEDLTLSETALVCS